MSQAPPPPPPHGEVPKSSGLPPGKYDIFVIPQHSAGSGFLYLPSLKPNVNSFAAGFACALIMVTMFQSMAPAFQAWWNSFNGMGNMGVTMLIVAVGVGAWALGRTQNDGPGGPGTGSGHGSPFGGTNAGTSPGGTPNTGAPPPPPHNGAPPPPGTEKPRASWQRPPQAGTTRAETPKGSWEKAREETRRKEEERKAKEEEQKRREEVAKRLKELREKEAREREQREREAKARLEKLEKEKREKETRERLEKERLEREAKEREEKRRKDEEEASAARKRPPAPTAKTYLGTDDDAYSFRPYDQPKRPTRRKSNSSLSERSWAPSQSTARTTPPPSFRAPYTTKDPDKIVIKAVYLFMNQYAKTPASQLVSGVGSVTDGLILRVTTEGLFIDDDVRSVPQREWDVKAWTLKQVETGEWRAKSLHLLRATVRDQEGKRYLFVLGEEESWKVAVGLQRLRRGTQVRALGVSGMSGSDARGTLEMLGWG